MAWERTNGSREISPMRGSPDHGHSLRKCESKCGLMRHPSGGVQIGNKWHCAECYRTRMQVGRKKYQ